MDANRDTILQIITRVVIPRVNVLSNEIGVIPRIKKIADVLEKEIARTVKISETYCDYWDIIRVQ